MSLKEEIAHLKVLYKRADPGPWTADIDDPDTKYRNWTGKFYTNHGTWCPYGDEERSNQHVHNAELVAAAVNILPKLIENRDLLHRTLMTISEECD